MLFGIFWTPSFCNHDLETAKPPVSHISYTQGQFNLHGTDKHLRRGLRYRSYLPEGRQHTVIEIPGGCEIWVLSICRVETPCSLGRQHDTARHKMTHTDVHVHNTHNIHVFGCGKINHDCIRTRCVADWAVTCMRLAAGVLLFSKCFCRCCSCTFRAKPDPRMPLKKGQGTIRWFGIGGKRNVNGLKIDSSTYSRQGKEGHSQQGKTSR